MMRPPDISDSTKEERAEYIRKKFVCISDCDMCGLCNVFHGKDPELAYRDYIEGLVSFEEISLRYQRRTVSNLRREIGY